jgi:hypothetical protein
MPRFRSVKLDQTRRYQIAPIAQPYAMDAAAVRSSIRASSPKDLPKHEGHGCTVNLPMGLTSTWLGDSLPLMVLVALV